jgi:hypothetical protein
MTTQEKNRAKAKELLPEVQWAALAWLEGCEKLGLQFRITEAYRTPERQNELWKSGRTVPGPWRTNQDGYKNLSYHQLRLAVDVYLMNCTYLDLEQVAFPLGITHPHPQDDGPHFQFDKVVKKPTLPIEPLYKLSEPEEMKRFARGLLRLPTTTPMQLRAKAQAEARFRKKYGVPFTEVL